MEAEYLHRRYQSPVWAATTPLKRGKTYLIVNQGCEGEEVEQIGEESPDVGISVFSEALVVKAIHLWNSNVNKRSFIITGFFLPV